LPNRKQTPFAQRFFLHLFQLLPYFLSAQIYKAMRMAKSKYSLFAAAVTLL
jgi:hypothetical protein